MQGPALTGQDLTLISQLGHLIIQRPAGEIASHKVRCAGQAVHPHIRSLVKNPHARWGCLLDVVCYQN